MDSLHYEIFLKLNTYNKVPHMKKEASLFHYHPLRSSKVFYGFFGSLSDEPSCFSKARDSSTDVPINNVSINNNKIIRDIYQQCLREKKLGRAA